MSDQPGTIRYRDPLAERPPDRVRQRVTPGELQTLRNLGCPPEQLKRFVTHQEAVASMRRRIHRLLDHLRSERGLIANPSKEWTANAVEKLYAKEGLSISDVPWNDAGLP